MDDRLGDFASRRGRFGQDACEGKLGRHVGPVGHFDQSELSLVRTVLVREWEQTSQRVMVMADGLHCEPARLTTAVQVALAITGHQGERSAILGSG